MKYSCDVFKACGSCQYMGIDYQEQLKKKTDYVKKLVKDARLTNIEVAPCHPSKNEIGYRNKVIVAFDNNYNYGLYEEGSHRIVPYKRCLIHDEVSDKIIKYLQGMFKKYRVSIYDKKRRKGLLRHVLIRRAVATDETMVVIVSNEDEFKGSKNLCQGLIKAFPSVKTVVLNINKRDTSIVLGDKEKVLYGKGFIVDKLSGLSFKISSKSFYQINHDQCEELYSFGLGLLSTDDDQVLLDTYSGIGTIGMIAAKDVNEVISVELNRDAYQDGINNAKANKINNIRFFNDDATKFMVKQAQMNNKVDIVIMDPPRAGSTPEFIQAVGKLQPKEVLYISCDPKTQVRDILEFQKYGYYTKIIYPFDMFPQTEHVETVVLLSQQKPSDHIKVDLDLDELDVTSAELKATYAEIKDYVLKEHGLKVSNLYISQVKRKCGLEVGENYNLAKSEDAKQPNCPEEKEKAIISAFKNFGMMLGEI